LKHIEISEGKIKGLSKFPVGYGKKLVVQVPYPESPREGKCDCCGRSRADKEIKRTALHHWKYAYHHNTIKKKPLLVLKNVNEFCFSCHNIADALRSLFEKNRGTKDWYLVKTALLMPEDMKERLDKFCNSYMIARKPELERKKYG